MTLLLSVLLALLLDYLFAEPKKFHPLIGFGAIAQRLEKNLNGNDANKLTGVFAWAVAVLPVTGFAYILQQLVSESSWLMVLIGAVILYLSVGWQSLLSHAMDVAYPLSQGNLDEAREAVARIVSRDVETMDEQAVATATTESVLENGADAIFSALFWFVLLGIPGVVFYRLCNTLDAMWGYKNERYKEFGWMAARADDVLNFIPARLTALSYLLMGNKEKAWLAWREQGANWKSPNAGPVMAAGAGAIDVKLGGSAVYGGCEQVRPILGLESSNPASADSIVLACQLLNRALLLWCGLFVLMGVV